MNHVLRILAALALGATLASDVGAQTRLPTGFRDSLVLGALDLPTAIEFVPGSTAAKWRLLFVEQKTARVRMVVSGALAGADPVMTVPNVRIAGGEQGLLGIALDPAFPARPFLYVHADDNRSAHIRISRFTLSGDLAFAGDGAMTADPASRYDLVTNIPDAASNHNGGTVRFGPDGMLYVSLGEDAVPCGAQDTTSLRGVILRLRVDTLPSGPGAALRSQVTPATNPYATHADSNARIVWAMGLRNPFRFQMDMPTGRLVIADVGQDAWEEIDIASAGGQNFGWPFFEANATGRSCALRSSAGVLPPIGVISHDEGVGSIMSAGVYRRVPGGAATWPAEYEGDVFYSDYYVGMLRRLHFDGSAWVAESAPGQPNSTDWGTGFNAVTDYRVGPDGALWYCRQGGAPADDRGEIRRVIWAEGDTITPPPPPPRPTLALRAWPVPASGELTIGFTLPSAGPVTLTVFDARGRQVRRLLEGMPQPLGTSQVVWDGRNDAGESAPAGLYWARLESPIGRRSIRLARVP